MNMLSESREVSNKWNIYLCPEVHKKVEQIVKDSRLKVWRSDLDTYKMVDKHNNVISLWIQKCSCRIWEVHGLLASMHVLQSCIRI